jgi:hypothetical protein
MIFFRLARVHWPACAAAGSRSSISLSVFVAYELFDVVEACKFGEDREVDVRRRLRSGWKGQDRAKDGESKWKGDDELHDCSSGVGFAGIREAVLSDVQWRLTWTEFVV